MPTHQLQLTARQERWNEITSDPLLSDLPYKVETNSRGQIVLSPQKNHHSIQQTRVHEQLLSLLDGRAFQEWAIATPHGTKQADVVWTSDQRLQEMRDTGDPTTLAPELCVEVMSESNDWDEMDEKRTIYREAGAEEVWIVDRDGTVHFFADEPLDTSRLAPAFPQSV